MNRSKKWTALLLTLLMLVNCLCINAFAAGDPPILLTTPEVMSSETVQVNIVANVSNITDGKLVFTYDAEKLSFVSLTTADAWNDQESVAFSVNHSAGKITLAFASASAAEKGEMFTLTFTAHTTGETEISLDGASSTITGLDAVADQKITVTVTTRTDILLGDVNRDNKVTIRDVIILLQNIALGSLEDLLPTQLAAADVNLDGSVNTRDAILILRTLASRTPIRANH